MWQCGDGGGGRKQVMRDLLSLGMKDQGGDD